MQAWSSGNEQSLIPQLDSPSAGEEDHAQAVGWAWPRLPDLAEVCFEEREDRKGFPEVVTPQMGIKV